MLKKIITFILVVAIFFTLAPSVFAEGSASGSMMKDEKMADVNSFELFWPIVAGKTRGDSFYFLKTLKEDLRGLIIFGNPEKANYSVLLATKRTVEAEKLINEGKQDLANKTLESAIKDVDSAEASVANAISSGDDFQGNGQAMSDSLKKIVLLADWLNSKNQNDLLQQLSQKSTSLSNKLEGK